MQVTISDFRKNLFHLVDEALKGAVVKVVYKGQTIRLVLENPGSKLDRLTPVQISNPGLSREDHARASKQLATEMQFELECDWAEL